MRRNINHAQSIKLSEEIINISNVINDNVKNYNKVPAFVQEIKGKIIKLKPILEKGGDVSHYIRDIENYFVEKINPVFSNIEEFRSSLQEFINDLK